MAQPTLSQVFGNGTTFTVQDGLTIPAQAFTDAGINDLASVDAITAFGAIVKNAHSRFFEANTDETVMATIAYSTQAPSFRNNLQKTAFNYAVSFYGAFVNPTFDPDDV